MLVIRLTRVGKKKDASYRVVVVESARKVKAGNYKEMVGSYDPRVDKADLNSERIKYWIGYGAKPSDTVHNLLISQKIIEGRKINVLPKKTVPKKDEEKTSEELVPVEEAVAEETSAGTIQ
jgi:small subunit ribosomal protein S16